MTDQDWASLKRLVTAFDEAHHLPVRFAEVHGLDSAQAQSEVVISEVDLFAGRAG